MFMKASDYNESTKEEVRMSVHIYIYVHIIYFSLLMVEESLYLHLREKKKSHNVFFLLITNVKEKHI